jgi:hypothetical protein
MCTLDKSHAILMTFLNTHEVNSMLDYDMLDIGTLDITASPEKCSTLLYKLVNYGCKKLYNTYPWSLCINIVYGAGTMRPKTLSITTFSITTHSITINNVTLSINDTKHYIWPQCNKTFYGRNLRIFAIS